MSLEVENEPVVVNRPPPNRSYYFEQRRPYHAAVKRLVASGKHAPQIAKELGIGRKVVYSCLRDLGINLVPSNQFGPNRRRVQYHDAVLRLHQSGASVLAIAQELGVDRTIIYSCMNDLRLRKRSASEANRIRMARMTADERRELAASAHATVRNSWNTATRINHAKRAQELGLRVGAFESEVGEYLQSQGIEVVPQMAWKGYNVDFFVRDGRVAVEVYTSSYRPVGISKTARKTMQLLSAGISVVDLWINRRLGETASPAMLEQLVAFINIAGPLPTGIGQYRVIRGRGEIDPVSQIYLDEWATIAIRYARMKARRADTD